MPTNQPSINQMKFYAIRLTPIKKPDDERALKHLVKGFPTTGHEAEQIIWMARAFSGIHDNRNVSWATKNRKLILYSDKAKAKAAAVNRTNEFWQGEAKEVRLCD